ncbi:MAG: DUF4097 family beta strand repeat-containing protein [Nitrososphaerota archaeon]|jgi:DUF4097 and DUF4098 domain-containing protein YvlB|nr:DUF4097 family beta strand repeat-containing protein [Nitrososphaerota archaeon]
MKPSAKIVLVFVTGLSIALIVLASGILSNSEIIEQLEDKTVYTPNANVAINANIFDGNIEIQSTSGSQIELIYTLKAPHNELSTIKIQTNETKDNNQTLLLTKAQSGLYGSSERSADLLIKLPTTSQYNLTLLSGAGNISVPKLNIQKIVVSTAKGNIVITDNQTCTHIEAISMTGDVTVNLAKNTLFYVAASVSQGSIDYSEISLDTEITTATRLKGATLAGKGQLALILSCANGKIALHYL